MKGINIRRLLFIHVAFIVIVLRVYNLFTYFTSIYYFWFNVLFAFNKTSGLHIGILTE